MKLSECTIGTIVTQLSAYEPEAVGRIGHIVGLDTNSTGEVIPVVQFAQPYRSFAQPVAPNDPVGVHHNNLAHLVD